MLSLCPMGRIIAIDYGRKRTGLAVTDTLQMIANGLTTVPSGELTRFLADYVSREPVERFVVGLPKQMNNELSENMRYVEDKGLVDEISAVIILQSYLENKKYQL